ncbi:hypothetical protein J2X16_002764 [Pelomonas aquatica]|uniref:Uncharacterized protein n=1 Tax=Pelomonas aquatica TaxID=431058 RepID=A0ABU1Z9V9_9BURK|nr:hypothetical protein [Pelomonas aquatica]
MALTGRQVPEISIEYDQLYYYFPEWRVMRDDLEEVA